MILRPFFSRIFQAFVQGLFLETKGTSEYLYWGSIGIMGLGFRVYWGNIGVILGLYQAKFLFVCLAVWQRLPSLEEVLCLFRSLTMPLNPFP